MQQQRAVDEGQNSQANDEDWEGEELAASGNSIPCATAVVQLAGNGVSASDIAKLQQEVLGRFTDP